MRARVGAAKAMLAIDGLALLDRKHRDDIGAIALNRAKLSRLDAHC